MRQIIRVAADVLTSSKRKKRVTSRAVWPVITYDQLTARCLGLKVRNDAPHQGRADKDSMGIHAVDDF